MCAGQRDLQLRPLSHSRKNLQLTGLNGSKEHPGPDPHLFHQIGSASKDQIVRGGGIIKKQL